MKINSIIVMLAIVVAMVVGVQGNACADACNTKKVSAGEAMDCIMGCITSAWAEKGAI